ncbi:CDP-glycerol glycerophosphotransferase family protein [Vibrio sp. SS-MA-C1-2]|uniref:CDP-glycerol glycerophosphotransferase family protein n=1 Tax=Vibrio sp. SS-MA-C1-2 TaxID=2908646 RepID=UPI0021A79A5C|nr:CDP-glycerol glycerophosphotransferase family protein [Vibrio sp. SS-MA-C1-2]
MKLFKYAVRLIISTWLFFVPKSNRVWVFGAWFGNRYSDNTRSFYEYVQKNSTDIRPIWIYKDEALKATLDSFDVEAYYFKSLKGIYYQAIAKVAFVSHSISDDLNPIFISINTVRVQLWHGIPLKRIGYDMPSVSPLLKKYSKLTKLLMNNHYDYYITNGDYYTNTCSRAFLDHKDKFLLTGFPRNDLLIQSEKKVV